MRVLYHWPKNRQDIYQESVDGNYWGKAAQNSGEKNKNEKNRTIIPLTKKTDKICQESVFAQLSLSGKSL